MTRLEEVILAFIGSAELNREPLPEPEQSNESVKNLISEGMVEIHAGRLFVTVKGWRFLHRRVEEHA